MAVPGVAEMQDVDMPYHVLIVLENCLQELYHHTHLPVCWCGLSSHCKLGAPSLVILAGQPMVIVLYHSCSTAT